MDLFLDIATRFGVPTAVLVIVLVYHVRVIQKKDAELARVNDLRVNEAMKFSNTAIEREGKMLDTMAAMDKTLTVVGDRMSRWRG